MSSSCSLSSRTLCRPLTLLSGAARAKDDDDDDNEDDDDDDDDDGKEEEDEEKEDANEVRALSALAMYRSS